MSAGILPYQSPLQAYEAEAEKLTSDTFDLTDARWVVAKRHCFRDWAALSEYAHAVNSEDSSVYRFESAVEAVVHGDAAAAPRHAGHPSRVGERPVDTDHSV